MTTKRHISEATKQQARQEVDLYQLANCDRLVCNPKDEWSGACPLCGGDDRFNVQPHYPTGGRWLCRHCTGGIWKDGIELTMRLDGISFPEAVRQILNEPTLHKRKSHKTAERKTPTATTRTPTLAEPPNQEWQTAVRRVVDECARYLFNDDNWITRERLDWLHERGLNDDTIYDARLGFNPKPREVLDGVWLQPGITIPCVIGENVWYLRTRLMEDAAVERARYELNQSGGNGDNATVVYDENGRRYLADDAGRRVAIPKYTALKGSNITALYNADELTFHRNAVVVEGELDALLLAQKVQGLDDVAIVTMGSATSLPDARWKLHLAHLANLFVILDNDGAGKSGLTKWQGLIRWAKPMPALLEMGEDITDAYLQGANLRAWVETALNTSVKV